VKDDPHLLIPARCFNILPVDGTYHFVTSDNTLDKLAKFYGVKVEDIVDWPSNGLDPNNPAFCSRASH